MLRSILRIQQLRSTIYLSGLVRNVSGEKLDNLLIHDEVVKKKANLRDEWIGSNESFNHYSTVQNVNRYSDEYLANEIAQASGTEQPDERLKQAKTSDLANTYDCADILSLFNLIEPQLADLKAENLTAIYDKINSLAYKSRSAAEDGKTMPIDELLDIMNTSSTFRSLISRTCELSEQLDPKCLVAAYRTFRLTNIESNNKQVKAILQVLGSKVDELELADISLLLSELLTYSRNPLFPVDLSLKLSGQLYKAAENKLMDANRDKDDLNLLISFLDIFSSNDSVSAHLINKLAASKHALDFRRSVILLRKLKTIPNLDQGPLIKECNSRIYEFISANPTRENAYLYLENVHERADSGRQNAPFYEARLLDVLTPILLKDLDLDWKSKHLIFHLIFNFSIEWLYDERLLKLMYNVICDDQEFSSKRPTSKFVFFTRFRLPFVDPTKLAQSIFENPKLDFNLGLKNKKLNLKILNDLIINDVQNTNLILIFNKLSRNFKQFDLRKISLQEFKLLNLAKVYLWKFSKLNETSKAHLERKLSTISNMLSMLECNPKIDQKIIQFNAKIQQNAYLSNGILLGSVAVYDKSIRDLIPIIEYKDYFHKIDQLPLSADQQL